MNILARQNHALPGLRKERRARAVAPATLADAGPDRLDGVVAVVGCDGTGKTTLVADLVAHLRARGPVERRYMGLISGETGDRIKQLPLLGTALERRLAAKVRRAQDMERKLPGAVSAVVMYLFSLWRAARLRRLIALSRRGVLVIAERYPQAEVPGFHYDGPGLAADRSANPLVRALARREQRLYDRLARHRPALVIRLTIDAATAHARKPDHPLPELRTKIEIMPRLTFNGATVRDVDARQPYPEVMREALAAIAAVAPAYAVG